MSVKYIEIVAGASDARYPADRSNANAAGIYVDSTANYQLRYLANGVVTPLQDNGGMQQGIEATSVLSLTGSVWHTGNGGANILSFLNPNVGAIIITRLIIGYTHISTGAATVAAGTTTVSKITAADNLIDDEDINGVAAPFAYSNFEKTDTEKTEAWLPAGGWVTFTASADPTGFAGNAYISYIAV